MKTFFVLKKTIDVQRKKYTKQLQVLFASSFIFHLVFFILENTSFKNSSYIKIVKSCKITVHREIFVSILFLPFALVDSDQI